MSKKTNKESLAEKILKFFKSQNAQKTADELRKEFKDRYGISKPVQDYRVNLLYLLRREQIKRKKVGSEYQYFL